MKKYIILIILLMATSSFGAGSYLGMLATNDSIKTGVFCASDSAGLTGKVDSVYLKVFRSSNTAVYSKNFASFGACTTSAADAPCYFKQELSQSDTCLTFYAYVDSIDGAGSFGIYTIDIALRCKALWTHHTCTFTKSPLTDMYAMLDSVLDENFYDSAKFDSVINNQLAPIKESLSVAQDSLNMIRGRLVSLQDSTDVIYTNVLTLINRVWPDSNNIRRWVWKPDSTAFSEVLSRLGRNVDNGGSGGISLAELDSLLDDNMVDSATYFAAMIELLEAYCAGGSCNFGDTLYLLDSLLKHIDSTTVVVRDSLIKADSLLRAFAPYVYVDVMDSAAIDSLLRRIVKLVVWGRTTTDADSTPVAARDVDLSSLHTPSSSAAVDSIMAMVFELWNRVKNLDSLDGKITDIDDNPWDNPKSDTALGGMGEWFAWYLNHIDTSSGGGTATINYGMIVDSVLNQSKIIANDDTVSLAELLTTVRMILGFPGASPTSDTPTWDTLSTSISNQLGDFAGSGSDNVRYLLQYLRYLIGFPGATPTWDSLPNSVTSMIGDYTGVGTNNIRDAIASVSAGSGAGAYDVRLYARVDSSYIQGVNFRVTNIGGGTSFYNKTNTSGFATLALDAGTWLVHGSLVGYQQSVLPETITFTGDYRDTILFTSNTSANRCQVWTEVHDITNDSGVRNMVLEATPNGTLWMDKTSGGPVYISKIVTAVTDTDGFASLNLIRSNSVKPNGKDTLKYTINLYKFGDSYASASVANYVVPDSATHMIVWKNRR